MGACALLLLPLAAAAQDAPDLAALRAQALALVNEDRAAADLPPLAAGETLGEIAIGHARDMAARGYYAHETPEGEAPRERFLGAGGSEWEVVAENIARCQGCPLPPDAGIVETLQEGWMDSPEHRANILAAGLSRFGFGLAAEGGTLYAVQDFAGPGTPRTGGAPDDAEALGPGEAAALALDLVNAAREAAGAAPLRRSGALGEAAAALLPPDLAGFDIEGLGDPGGALPERARGRFRRVASIAGTCGGCGTAPTRGDVRAFVGDWLEPGAYRGTLLDPDLERLGLAVGASGDGRKAALALLGSWRDR